MSSSATYKFQVEAWTNPGDYLVILGSVPELGSWNFEKALKLQTNGERYPLWWTEQVDMGPLGADVEYKYIMVRSDGGVEWEASHSQVNRSVKVAPGSITVHDFIFGKIQPCAFGFHDPPLKQMVPEAPPGKLKIAVLGSSVACGCNAWELQGWACLLGNALREKYGHVLVNCSESGASTRRSLERFDQAVASLKPNIVIISLSLGNEGFFHCPPEDREKLKQGFEMGIEKLVSETKRIGAQPMITGPYPNGDANAETYSMLKDTERKLRKLGEPMIQWRDAVDNGQGRWKDGIFTDSAHPNTEGHRLMFQCIDLSIFENFPSINGESR